MRARWTVTAVDMAKKHARYNPAATYYVTDGLDFIRRYGHEYDAIHVSPPCQWYTRGNAKDRATGGGKWERTIPTFRDALLETGRPYVLENVEDAAWDMRDPVKLCGCMFDLSTIDTDGVRIHLQRPRLFETNWDLTAPRPCDHSDHEWVAGAYGGARRDKYEAKYVRRGGYVPPDKAVVKALLGIEHEMTWEGLFECVPPAYCEWIGNQLAAHAMAVAA
jgi:DNA (cytosine-5)-methyltransferase 1